MRWLDATRTRLKGRSCRDREIAEELAFHQAERARRLEAEGLKPEAARQAARQRLGNDLRWRERCQEVWIWRWWEDLWQDLAIALRGLRRNPGFAATVIVIFALAIGANTAIFSVVRAVLLQPLPFAHPRQLVTLGPEAYSLPNYLSLRRRAQTLSGLAAYVGNGFSLTGQGRPLHLHGEITAGAIFQVLGVRPALGRGFRRRDDRPGAVGGADAVILSHRLWEQAFGGQPAVVGRHIQLRGQSGHDYTVIGVMPAGFQFPLGQQTGVWTTIAPLRAGLTKQRGLNLFHLIGRRRAGVTLGQVQAEMAGIARRLGQQYPSADGRLTIPVLPARQAIEGRAGDTLWLLFAAVGLVLLIGCVNAANLFLARGAGRRQEMAVRAALGAGPGRLSRQLLVESAVLGVLGGAAGLLVAAAAVAGLLHLAPQNLPRLGQAGLSWPVAGFALAVGLAAGLLFGWLPAAGRAHGGLNAVLNEAGRSSTQTRGQRRRQGILAAAECALALALVIGAGLLLRSLGRLQATAPGFQPAHVLTAAISLPSSRYSFMQMAQFYQRLMDGLEAQPGIVAAGSGHTAPFSGNPPYGMAINWPLKPLPPAARPVVPFNVVTPDYFRALQIPLLRGRGFRRSDKLSGPDVVMVNHAFARRYFGAADPIGARLDVQFAGFKQTAQIIGEIGDVRRNSLRAPEQPMIYLTEAQFFGFGSQAIMIRASGAAATAAGPLRAVVARLDPDLPVFAIHPMDELLASSMARLRFATWLLGLFAALALLLAVVGLYAVMAQMAASRRREAGIRLALGAPRGSVLGLMVGQGMRFAIAGATAGLLAAWAGARALGSLLYGIGATDPLVFIAGAVVLLLAALAACYFPARGAARTDPAVALRQE